jgi:hypothetical protein
LRRSESPAARGKPQPRPIFISAPTTTTAMNTPTNANATPGAAPAETPGPVRWDTRQLKTSYVNFANAHSTQEEVVLNFGINNNWDRTGSPAEIELAHRLVMSPYAAKRLAELLQRLVSQYESRYGVLK